MHAIVFHNYGSPDVLRLEEVQKPVLQENEVLVKVVAASTAAGDWHRMRVAPYLLRLSEGLLKPKNPRFGADVAGRVEAVGKAVTQFRPGDAVFGDLSTSGFGAFAEYVAVPENAFVLKPTNMTFEQAAAVPVSAVPALQRLTRDEFQPGQKVLIYGASGGVGTFAVQIAKGFGAEVTAIYSTGKMEMVRSLGADHVIDYTKEDFTQNGKQYNQILAANGYHPLSAYQRALARQGIYVMTGGSMQQMLEAMILGPLRSKMGGQTMGNLLARPNQKHLSIVKDLIEAGKVTPVIDQCFPLHDVADAIRHVEAGHAKGKVVITVEHKGTP